ncbi:NAD(P)H-dependent flavin oxidoreductase [Smaragdicoccus niigatensis]|uniref:NAD(P)H-dependent flavin oxidoreductase n=1 Tax=Smaragdicoccus niigatensis TaxID=359359 RepID=UPI00039BF3BD|nr:nitronate monooxygenase [Smaragdicoccus niigatensis]
MSLLDSAIPIVAAPMAGGPTTVALSIAVHGSGGFPFLAAGYKSVEALAEEIRQVRSVGGFGVNLFVPSATTITAEEYRRYRAELQAEADALGAELPLIPRSDDDDWDAKIDLLVASPVPAVSFTFGLPSHADLARLKKAGTTVFASVTTPDEARAAYDLGADALVVQGASAGGHSATFDPQRTIEETSTAELVRAVRSVTPLPIVAAGGVDGPSAVRALLESGAEAVAVGTLLLRTDEAGTSRTHRDALADPAFSETVLTHAFTGRTARGLRNGFIDRHEALAPFGYPEIHHLTRPLRQAASQAGDPGRLHLWAGTGYTSAPDGPATGVIRWLTDAV